MTISISFCFRAISMDNDYTTRVAKKTWPKKMSKINCPAIYFLSLWQMMTKDYFLHKEGGWNLITCCLQKMWLLWLTNLPKWKSENKTEGKFGSLPFFLSFIHSMWLRLIPLVNYDKEKWSSASACIAFSTSAVLCFLDLRKDKTVFPKCCVWDLLLWEIHATAAKRTVLIVTSWECTNALRPTQLDNCHNVLFLANPEQIWG